MVHLFHMDWSTRRKVVYGVAALFSLFAITAFILQDVFFPEPTCFDQEKNGFEAGIDCGGTCSLMCSTDIVPIAVLWARALPSSDGSYDLVGLIENKNIDNTPKSIGYTFTVFSDQGRQLYVYSGTTTISVEDEKPILITNQFVNGIPGKVTLSLSPAYHYRAKDRPKMTLMKTLRIRYEEGDIYRAYVTVKNMTQKTFADLPVRVVLYDAQRNAVGAGETLIKLMGPEEEKEVVFTWNTPFVDPPASTVVYYDFGEF